MGRLKKNLKEMSIANGKIWQDDQSITKHPYLSLGAEGYESKIRAMNLLDLQTHASSILVPIKDNRESLIKTLLKEFKIRNNS